LRARAGFCFQPVFAIGPEIESRSFPGVKLGRDPIGLGSANFSTAPNCSLPTHTNSD